MPFGEELFANSPNRTETSKYTTSADKLRKRFTGYEKDTETGLDFAEARYYQNKHGRFTAVDPLLASGKSGNPQTFNRYTYVLNNPIILTDPDGLQAGTHIGRVYTNGNGAYYPTQVDGTHQFTGESLYVPATDGFTYMMSSGGYYSIGNTAEMAARGETNAMADSRTREAAYASSSLPSSWISILQLDPPGYAEAARTANRGEMEAAQADMRASDSLRAFGMAVGIASTFGGALGSTGAPPRIAPARSSGADLVTVNHRTSPQNMNSIMNSMTINPSKAGSLEGGKTGVWVSNGGVPNLFTRVFSGTSGSGGVFSRLFPRSFPDGSASITFQVPRSAVQNPGFGFKMFYGPAQRIIPTQQPLQLPPDTEFRGYEQFRGMPRPK